MSNDNWDNSEDWKEQDGGLFGNRAMSPEARNILKHMKSMGITDEEPEGAVKAYEDCRKQFPNAKKFDELPSEVQTTILSRYHHRSSNWNKRTIKDENGNIPNSAFFNVLMQGGDDPAKLKADLSKALKEDRATTGNSAIQNRLRKESLYLAGDPNYKR